MKYQVGDRVIIKREDYWIDEVLDDLSMLPDRIATIKEVVNGEYGFYYMKEIDWYWNDDEIEELVSEIEITRFELMEL